MRVADSISLSVQDRQILRRWSRGRSTPARLVTRANIVLRSAEGQENKQIAAELVITEQTVGRWRRRFASAGLAGIQKDAPRGGRKPTVREGMARRIIETTTQQTPKDATHWSTRTLAKFLGIDKMMVQRVWQANGLKPHRVKTFKVSNDP